MSKPPFNSGAQPASAAILYRNFQLVAEKLTCHQHPGENQWCWVKPHPPNAGHIPLCQQDVQLWARYLVSDVAVLPWCFIFLTFLQHDHPEDASSMMLPNTNHFTKLLDTRPPHGATLTHTPTELVIHTHHEDSHARTIVKAPYTQRLSRQNAVYLEADGGSISSEDQHQIRTILSALHAMYPALDYPQYEDQLQQQGILYLIIASMFKANFYIAKVGMVPGAAYLFCHWVEED